MIAPNEVRATLIRMLAVELSISEESVAVARSLRADLGMDSIAAANLLFALEEELGIELDEIPPIETLDDLEAAVQAWIEVKGR